MTESMGIGKSEPIGARRSKPEEKVEEDREPGRERKTSGAGLVCYYCKERGHTKWSRREREWERKTSGMGPVCYYCKERGHIKKLCRKREWNKAREKENTLWKRS